MVIIVVVLMLITYFTIREGQNAIRKTQEKESEKREWSIPLRQDELDARRERGYESLDTGEGE